MKKVEVRFFLFLMLYNPVMSQSQGLQDTLKYGYIFVVKSEGVDTVSYKFPPRLDLFFSHTFEPEKWKAKCYRDIYSAFEYKFFIPYVPVSDPRSKKEVTFISSTRVYINSLKMRKTIDKSAAKEFQSLLGLKESSRIAWEVTMDVYQVSFGYEEIRPIKYKDCENRSNEIPSIIPLQLYSSPQYIFSVHFPLLADEKW